VSAETIIRIAAKGDGVTESGRHVPFAAPGDRVLADGTIEPGPHHIAPPCRHFGTCGGCQLQHCDDAALADFVRDRVVNAMAGQGLSADLVTPATQSPPETRRRASLRAINGGGRPLIGFREAGSHRVIDLAECPVLVPELWSLIAPLHALLARQRGKYGIDIELTHCDEGVDLMLKGLTVEGLEETEALLEFARRNELARLSLDQGYGAETVWEPQQVHVTIGWVGTKGTRVPYPPGAFLQPTFWGETGLTAAGHDWLADASAIADLFSGLGTFAFALADPAKVLAVEAARDAHLACKAAAGTSGKPVSALHRDLFRNPLQPDELNRFDAVLLDPPRAGAREQAKALAESKVPRVAYISCNPSSWARDAAMLVEGGYRLKELRPVGQFRWSTHVELASLFVR